jgi:transcription initiation factor IIE alpha subunit
MTACSKGAKAKRVDSAALNKKDAKDDEISEQNKVQKKRLNFGV